MSPPAKKPIVVLKTGEPVALVREVRGEFHEWITRALRPAWDGEVVVLDVRTGEPLPDPEEAAAFVITGSAAHVPTREPWMLRLEGWLREAVVGAGKPTLGICFGHQILAQALGGEVQRNPNGREIGTVVVERTADDPIFEGLPASFAAQATHVDSVVRLPPSAVPLARSSLDPSQAIRFTETCYGVQFHPEFDAEVMRGYIEARRDVLAAEALDPEDLLVRVAEADAARETLRNFVRHVVPRGQPSPRRSP